MPRFCKRFSTSFNTSTNWLKISAWWLFSSNSSIIASAVSSLLDGNLLFSSNNCGAIQARRNLVNDAKIVMYWLSSWFACSSAFKRVASYSACSFSLNAKVKFISVFSGNSVNTVCLVRRRINGAMRVFRVSACGWFLSALPKRFLNTGRVCKKPGIKKLNKLHSSPKWFSIGVPDRAILNWPLSANAALALKLKGFLIACASSKTILAKENCASCSPISGSKP